MKTDEDLVTALMAHLKAIALATGKSHSLKLDLRVRPIPGIADVDELERAIAEGQREGWLDKADGRVLTTTRFVELTDAGAERIGL